MRHLQKCGRRTARIHQYAFAAAKMYVIACDARAVLPAPCGARARPDRMVEDVDQHRLGGHSKRQGRRAVLRRSCIEPRSSHVGWGVLKGGRSMLRRCSGGAAGEARAASAAGAVGAQRLQRAAQSAAHDPRPTPSAAPSHARRSTLCTLTDQLLLSGPPL